MKTPKNIQSQKSRLETPNKKQNSDTLRGFDEEILKEAKKRVLKLNHPCQICNEVIYIGTGGIIENIPQHYKCYKEEAIALTREACEKRFEIGWHKESFEKGQKAERQRILEIINECHTRYGTHQRGNDMKNCIDPDELKREVLKDGM